MLSLEDFFTNPRKTLVFGFAVACCAVALTAIFRVDSYRDVAACYGYYAGVFGRGDFAAALPPALPTLPILLPGLLCLLGLPPALSVELVSGAFYALAAIPLFFLLKNFLEAKHAAWGVLLYVLAPKIIRFGCAGLTEAYRNFFLIWSLAIAFSYARSCGAWKHIAFGIALAGLALSRCEGLALAAFILVMGVVFIFKGQDAPDATHRLAKGLPAILFAFALCVGPVLYRGYKDCGYPVIDARIGYFINQHILGKPVAAGEALIETSKGQTISLPSQLNANFRGAYEIYAVFALLGAIVLWRRKEWLKNYTWLLALLLANALCFAFTVISYRYFIPNLILLMPLTVIGFVWLLDGALALGVPRWLLALALLVAAALQLGNGLEPSLSQKPLFEKRTAQWIAKNERLFGHSGENGLMRIYSPDAREVCLWIPYESANPWGVARDCGTFKDFDLAVLRVPKDGGDERRTRVMDAREDLEKIKHPHDDKLFIYRPKVAAPVKQEKDANSKENLSDAGTSANVPAPKIKERPK